MKITLTEDCSVIKFTLKRELSGWQFNLKRKDGLTMVNKINKYIITYTNKQISRAVKSRYEKIELILVYSRTLII